MMFPDLLQLVRHSRSQENLRIMMSKCRRVIVTVTLASALVIFPSLISLTPPFYPKEAEKRGAKVSEYGLTFGIAHLANFLGAPFFSNIADCLGLKNLFMIASLTQGFAGITFGCLSFINDKILFLTGSYLMRILDGFAQGCSWCAIITISITLFPNNVATVMGWSELCIGVGYVLGPVIGVGLYEVGGFPLPFWILGVGCLVVAMLTIIVIPPDSKDLVDKSQNKHIGLGRSKLIWFGYLDNLITFVTVGAWEAIIESFMRHTKEASSTDVAMNFTISALFYILGSPLFGKISDLIEEKIVIVSILGNALMAVSYVFIGPCNFIPLAPSVALTIAASAISSFGSAAVVVSSFGRLHSALLNLGLKDDTGTYLKVSALWSSSFALGNFVGPIIAGLMVDNYGHLWTLLGCSVLHIFTFFLCLIELSFTIFVADLVSHPYKALAQKDTHIN